MATFWDGTASHPVASSRDVARGFSYCLRYGAQELSSSLVSCSSCLNCRDFLFCEDWVLFQLKSCLHHTFGTPLSWPKNGLRTQMADLGARRSRTNRRTAGRTTRSARDARTGSDQGRTGSRARAAAVDSGRLPSDPMELADTRPRGRGKLLGFQFCCSMLSKNPQFGALAHLLHDAVRNYVPPAPSHPTSSGSRVFQTFYHDGRQSWTEHVPLREEERTWHARWRMPESSLPRQSKTETRTKKHQPKPEASFTKLKEVNGNVPMGDDGVDVELPDYAGQHTKDLWQQHCELDKQMPQFPGEIGAQAATRRKVFLASPEAAAMVAAELQAAAAKAAEEAGGSSSL